ncbi:class I SAM-dependent RNA methyltransferase, partial [Asticcacaulis biprosthecium]|uniref:class I SAM-dependent RNA methyltransferase n=1 Tax=Asticcacaulis biprosthecium TaxID=76891 RepID=UPI00068296FD
MADFEAHIDKVGFQGDGITAGGLIIPMTLPGERVLARQGKERPELVEVLDASPQRVTPPCPHFAHCGGCTLQHWDLAGYSAWKQEVVTAQLLRGGLETEVLPGFTTPPHSRRRVGLHARKQGKQVQIGFKARKSWSLVPIEVCAISYPAIVAALPMLLKLAAPLFEHPKSAPILHVTASLTGLDIDISGVERTRTGGLSADARMQIAMTAAEADFARVTLGDDILYQVRQPMIRFGKATVALPAGSFLQATPQAEAIMAALVKDAVAGAKKVADLFCGAGTFTFPLAETAVVYAADGAAPSIAALKQALASAPGLKTINPEVRDLFRRPMVAEDMKG